jgi:uncharacterized repeat protein (TIGR03809 family)
MRIVATTRSSEDIARAWRALIQKRRENLTELYRSGRYKRYFTEEALLHQMRESAKAAQEWDALIARKAAPAWKPALERAQAAA